MSNFFKDTIDRITGADEVAEHVNRLLGENSGAGTLGLHAAIERGLGADGHDIVHDPELRKEQYMPLGFNLVDEEHGSTLLDPALPHFHNGDFVDAMPGQTDIVNGTVSETAETDSSDEFARVISFPPAGARVAIRGAMQADNELAA
jgi:hypothetical protein